MLGRRGLICYVYVASFHTFARGANVGADSLAEWRERVLKTKHPPTPAHPV
jgi:hypothetical protein